MARPRAAAHVTREKWAASARMAFQADRDEDADREMEHIVPLIRYPSCERKEDSVVVTGLYLRADLHFIGIAAIVDARRGFGFT
jgi:hypothetical protein